MHAGFALLLLGQWRQTSAVMGMANPEKFLIVSAPRYGQIAYMNVRKGGTVANLQIGGKRQDDPMAKMTPLITSGLVHPQGIAVEQRRSQLLVADPDVKKVYAYRLSSYESKLIAGGRTVLADGAEARWVTVDGIGNVFFSDEPGNKILKISAEQAARGDTTPQVVYDGTSLTQLSSPGGISADSFHTFWVNKIAGTRVGSIVRGSQVSGGALSQVAALARNSDKSYGLCVAYNNIFYTQPEKVIFGVKKAGSPVAVVSNRLTNPRGCVWDGDGTVYVADKGANAVYAFAANMLQIGATELVKAVDFEDAFGVAVFSGACGSNSPLRLAVNFLMPVVLLLRSQGLRI